MKYYKKLGVTSKFTIKGKVYPENYKKEYSSTVSFLADRYPSDWQEVPAGDYFVQENRLPECFRVKMIKHPLRGKYIEWWKNEFNSEFYYEGTLGKFYGFDSYDRTNSLNATINENLPENAIELTLEQWDKIVNKNVIEEFKLPEKWCVKPSKETSEWFNKNSQTNARDYHTMNCGYLHYPKVTKYLHHYDTIQSGYTEITFEQFIKYVLNQEVMEEKEIIGYKLKEEFSQYIKTALIICNTTGNWENSLMIYDISIKQTSYINRLKQAGVFDLWFEPVYKEEIPDIKIGAYIYMIDACGADKEYFSKYNGDVLKVTSFKKEKLGQLGLKDSYWLKHTPGSFSGGGFRVHESAWEYGVHFRKATKEEILKHLQAEFTKRTGIDVGSEVTINTVEDACYNSKLKEWYQSNLFYGNRKVISFDLIDDKLVVKISSTTSNIFIAVEALQKANLTFGGCNVTFEKVTSGVRITCNGETGTLSQMEQIFDFITGFPTFKFGSQKLEKIEFPSVNVYLDELTEKPLNIKIGCTFGTWKEFCDILEAAKKLENE